MRISHHLFFFSWWWFVLLLLLLIASRIPVLDAQATTSSCAASTATPATTVHIVSTTQEAAKLGQDILLCPGLSFKAEWQGHVSIAQPFELANGTSLVITGSSNATIDGQGDVSLFVVNGSTLLVEGVVLSGGNGIVGGVVAAREGAKVTFLDCQVYGNNASSKGGMYVYAASGELLVRRYAAALLLHIHILNIIYIYTVCKFVRRRPCSQRNTTTNSRTDSTTTVVCRRVVRLNI